MGARLATTYKIAIEFGGIDESGSRHTIGHCTVRRLQLCCCLIYNVTGTNLDGATLTGTIDATAGLTTISPINLVVFGPPNSPASIQLTSIQSYAMPLLEALNPGSNALPYPVPIYLSFAGGPTIAYVNNLIKTEHDAVVNPLESQLNNLIATNFLGINDPEIAATEAALFGANAFYDVTFTATAVAAVPEPSSYALMIVGFLGLGWVAYRKKGALRLA